MLQCCDNVLTYFLIKLLTHTDAPTIFHPTQYLSIHYWSLFLVTTIYLFDYEEPLCHTDVTRFFHHDFALPSPLLSNPLEHLSPHMLSFMPTLAGRLLVHLTLPFFSHDKPPLTQWLSLKLPLFTNLFPFHTTDIFRMLRTCGYYHTWTREIILACRRNIPHPFLYPAP